MTEPRGATVALVLLAVSLAALMACISAMAETHIWDDEADFEGGVYESTYWDRDLDGVTLDRDEYFEKNRANPRVSEGIGGAYDDEFVGEPCILYANGSLHIYYAGHNGAEYNICLGRCTNDIETFTKLASPVLVKGSSGWDNDEVRSPCVIYEDGLFKMWYEGYSTTGGMAIGFASSHDGISWTKYGKNPVIDQPSSGWGSYRFGDPTVIKVEGTYYMYLTGRASSSSGSTIGIATSSDGLSWTLDPSNPVLRTAGTGMFGQYEVLDGSVVRDGVGFRLFFTGRNSNTAPYRIGSAHSEDLYTWEHDGPMALANGTSTYDSYNVGSPCARWINGVLWMAYGGDDGSKNYHVLTAQRKPWFVRSSSNPVLTNGTGTSYDYHSVHHPAVVKNQLGWYQMFYTSIGGSPVEWTVSLATATSITGPWSKDSMNPYIDHGSSGDWDDSYVLEPCAVLHNLYPYVYYSGSGGPGTDYAIGLSIGKMKNASNPVLTGTPDEWDSSGVRNPYVVKVGTTLHMYYLGFRGSSRSRIGHATSTDGVTWTKDPNNPVLVVSYDTNGMQRWDSFDITDFCVIQRGGRLLMLYTGSDGLNTLARAGMAWSDDGSHWVRDPTGYVLENGNSSQWDESRLYISSAIEVDGSLYGFYSAYTPSQYLIGMSELTWSSGTYTTPALDASSSWPVEWGCLDWDADVPSSCSLKFQVATNNGGSIWDFKGPDGRDDTYYETPGQAVYPYQSGRYIRVRAFLERGSGSAYVPVLGSIGLTYQARPSPSPPTVVVTSPNGGEDWMKTKQYPVTWTAVGNFGTTPVDLYYSVNNGTTWSTIALNRANSGLYRWTVPSTETSGALVRIVVTDIDGVSTEDTSDATFAIDPPPPKTGAFLSPAAGDVLAPGTHGASWVVDDPWGLAELPLTLELTTDGGLTWTVLADALALSGGVDWDVPALAESSDECRLRLSVLNWLGDISVIESGTFSVDVMAPTVVLGPLGTEMVIGDEVVVTASTTDDLGVRGAALHVLSASGVDRAYAMELTEDGTWSSTYVATEGDVQLWVEATDGRHDVESARSDFSVRPKGSSDPTHDHDLVPLVVVIVLLCMLVLMLLTLSSKKGRRS